MRKLLCGVLLLAVPCVAMAANPSGISKKAQDAKFDEMFSMVDTNKSGKISKDEAKQRASDLFENFEALDANHDGGLTKSEIKQAIAAAEKRRRDFSQNLEKADTDKNGKLSREESKALPNLHANFDAIDSNHDEQLVMKEIAEYVRANADNSAAVAATAK